MSIEDYDEVFYLWKKTEGVGLSESDDKQNIALFLKRNPELSFVVRHMEAELVGAVLCGHDARRGYLHHLAVDSKHRRKGIGRGMVEMCLLRLATVGIPKCNIFLFADNIEGKAFWLHNGWNERIDLRIMQKVIKK